jgi:hypothetical protein
MYIPTVIYLSKFIDLKFSSEKEIDENERAVISIQATDILLIITIKPPFAQET